MCDPEGLTSGRVKLEEGSPHSGLEKQFDGWRNYCPYQHKMSGDACSWVIS